MNDQEYDGKHLKDVLNLYKTSDTEPPIIAAEIEVSKAELIRVIEKHNEADKDKEGFEPIESVKLKYFKQPSIEIERNLDTLEYSITDPELEFLNPLAESIINRTPYILYNDDFMDRPPNEVEIPKERPKKLSGWLAIYERLFKSTDQAFSLFELRDEDDDRRVNAILSDVEVELNTRLTKAWKTFNLSNSTNLKIKLTVTPNKEDRRLRIEIVEKVGTKDRFFNLADRSKGFLWAFNFVMKLEFSPKISGPQKDTVFLLDEPGSYLHPTAQEKLCHKLKNISQKHGNVIYCTHSHHLLNPDHIPLNKAYIVQKKLQKGIQATLLANVDFKKSVINAYRPILDAPTCFT